MARKTYLHIHTMKLSFVFIKNVTQVVSQSKVFRSAGLL